MLTLYSAQIPLYAPQGTLIEVTGWEEKRILQRTLSSQKAAAEADNTKKTVKKINSSVEKTTLGDLDALAALKSQLENK